MSKHITPMAALKKLEQQNNRLKSSYHTASEKRAMKAAREKRQATRAEGVCCKIR